MVSISNQEPDGDDSAQPEFTAKPGVVPAGEVPHGADGGIGGEADQSEGGQSDLSGVSAGTLLRELATRADDGLARGVERVVQLASDGLDSAASAASSFTTSAKERARKVGESTADFLKSSAAKALAAVAGDPSVPESLGEKIVKFAPIIGTGKLYADAWSKFHRAKADGDDHLMHQARKECVLAFGSAGLDLTSVVGGRIARLAAPLTRIGVFAKLFGALHNKDTKYFDRKAEEYLAKPGVLKVVNAVLEGVAPQAPQSSEGE